MTLIYLTPTYNYCISRAALFSWHIYQIQIDDSQLLGEKTNPIKIQHLKLVCITHQTNTYYTVLYIFRVLLR